MCDMRGPPSVINYTDGSSKRLEYRGHLDPGQHPSQVGIYGMGASGYGYHYYDGRTFWDVGHDCAYLDIWQDDTADPKSLHKCRHLATLKSDFWFTYEWKSLCDFKTFDSGYKKVWNLDELKWEWHTPSGIEPWKW